jgi:hypothetical protein
MSIEVEVQAYCDAPGCRVGIEQGEYCYCVKCYGDLKSEIAALIGDKMLLIQRLEVLSDPT